LSKEKSELFQYAGTARLTTSGKMLCLRVKGVSPVYLNIPSLEAVIRREKDWCPVVEKRSSRFSC
jgi:hypothetical protein